MGFGWNFSEEVRKKAGSERRREGGGKHSFVEYEFCQTLHTQFLSSYSNPVNYSFSPGQKWRLRGIDDSNSLKGTWLVRSPTGILLQITLLPKYMLFDTKSFPGWLCTIWCNRDITGSWMLDEPEEKPLKSPTVKVASFKPTRKCLFSFRTLIILPLVISPSLHRYLVSVPWHWKGGSFVF